MIKSVSKRLILLYTCSTGMILTAVIMIAAIYTSAQAKSSKLESFTNHYYLISSVIQRENSIRDLWLAENESEKKMIIHVEDNGNPLFYQGAWKSTTNRDVLIDKVKTLAKQENIYLDRKPISYSEQNSSTFTLRGSHKDQYLAAVSIFLVADGYRSVVILQDTTVNKIDQLALNALYIVLDIMGVCALYFISRWFVGKTLKPVEESKKRQTEFIASVSHELKSPLAVISANASAIKEEPQQAQQFITVIENECIRMSGLIEDMLMLASADSKTWKIKKERIDVDLLLIELFELFYSFCKERKKELKLELNEERYQNIIGDKERIKQLLAILIDNAAAYSNEGDTIVLRAYTLKKYLWIEVEDHGIGIAPDKKNEIFDRFYQADKARSKKNHFGLGLSIAKELIELHKGSIFVKDTPEGGATFVVKLPHFESEDNIRNI